jgi:HEAT repeat protein
MKLPVAVILCFTLVSLIGCDSADAPGQKPAAPAATVAPAAGQPDSAPLESGQYLVDLGSGAVSIRANQVDELALFEAVAAAAGFTLLTGTIDWKVVSVDIRAESLHAAVVELVKDYPYEIVYAPVEGSAEEVLSEVVIGEPLLTEAPDSAPAETTDDDLAAIEAIKEFPEHERQLAYLEALQSPSPKIRAAAAKKVKPVGDGLERMTDMIVNDPSPEVRIATTWSLELSDGAEIPQARDALVQCLADKDLNVVVECIQSLKFLDDPAAIVHLQPLLTHEDADVRTAAFEAIEWMQ